MDSQQNDNIRYQYLPSIPSPRFLPSLPSSQVPGDCLKQVPIGEKKFSNVFLRFRRIVFYKCPNFPETPKYFPCEDNILNYAPVPLQLSLPLQVRDHLILQPTKWQWAVNWLKSKMTESSSYWSPGSDSVMSNFAHLFLIPLLFRCLAMRRAVQEPSIGPHPHR